MQIENRVRGSLLSGAVADAFGSLYENQLPEFGCEFRYSSFSTTTDDTQLSLATCKSIRLEKGIIPAKIAANFLQLYLGEGIRGIGSTTHKNDEAFAGALAVALTVRAATSGIPIDSVIESIIDHIPDTRLKDSILGLHKYNDSSIRETAKAVGNSGFVAESVPLAIFAATKIKEKGIVEILEEVVQCGGDTDTIASMTAQISGAFIGLDHEIVAGLDKLDEKNEIVKTVDEFSKYVSTLVTNKSMERNL
ncbi:ADP-ribosylglycohydrolase family protein [Verrucomicrobia bacterium]|nr:ADP-ribosylglycohydrolase family protein [Verrucomicrobiota bacterium]